MIRQLLLAMTVLAALVPTASAADERDPGAFILFFARRADTVMQSDGVSGPPAPEHLRTLLREDVDLAGSLRLILGDAWDRADPPQREAMLRAFEDYLVRLFGARFRGFGGRYPEIHEIRMLADGQASVMTTIPLLGAGSLPVEWRLESVRPPTASGEENRVWRIVDVTLAGIDAVIFFRDSFASTLKSGGISKLAADLGAKSRP